MLLFISVDTIILTVSITQNTIHAFALVLTVLAIIHAVGLTAVLSTVLKWDLNVVCLDFMAFSAYSCISWRWTNWTFWKYPMVLLRTCPFLRSLVLLWSQISLQRTILILQQEVIKKIRTLSQFVIQWSYLRNLCLILFSNVQVLIRITSVQCLHPKRLRLHYICSQVLTTIHSIRAIPLKHSLLWIDIHVLLILSIIINILDWFKAFIIPLINMQLLINILIELLYLNWFTYSFLWMCLLARPYFINHDSKYEFQVIFECIWIHFELIGGVQFSICGFSWILGYMFNLWWRREYFNSLFIIPILFLTILSFWFVFAVDVGLRGPKLWFFISCNPHHFLLLWIINLTYYCLKCIYHRLRR